MKIRSTILSGRLHGQRLTYALLFLAEAALLGEIDLLFTAGVLLNLVGKAALALTGVDFDRVAGGFLVVEGATRGFFGLL